jgi:hypothetical protein
MFDDDDAHAAFENSKGESKKTLTGSVEKAIARDEPAS